MNLIPPKAKYLNKQSSKAPLAFIVGEGRSGTTLLSAIINRHSQVCVTAETHFFRGLEKLGDSWEIFLAKWPASGVKFLNSLNKFDLHEFSANDILGLIDKTCPMPQDIFIALGEMYLKQTSKKYWIEKTPNHLLYLDQILRLFPDSKIIHIVRDGRDVALSLSKVNWASDGYFENLCRWHDSLLNSTTSFKKNIHNNEILIRYEDLLTKPHNKIKNLCDILGIKFESGMLEPDGTEAKIIGGADWKANVNKKIDCNNAYKWKKVLDENKKKASVMLVGRTLERYGYSTFQDSENSLSNIRVHKDILKKYPLLIDILLPEFVQQGFSIKIEYNPLIKDANNYNGDIWLLSDISVSRISQGTKNRIALLIKLASLFRFFLNLKKNNNRIVYIITPRKNKSWWFENCVFILVKKMSDVLLTEEDLRKDQPLQINNLLNMILVQKSCN